MRPPLGLPAIRKARGAVGIAGACESGVRDLHKERLEVLDLIATPL